MNTSPSSQRILWRQVAGIATVQGAITLTWLIYRLYLPQLLAGFGFPGLDKIISIIEDALATVIEPLMGGLSDRSRQFMGSRFPLIAIGIVLSSVLFIAIPIIFIFGKPLVTLHWFLPIILIFWALAMAIFRSPAMALLGQYATPAALPQATSVVVLAGGLVSAFKPISSKFILSLGPPVAFFIGSLVLLMAVAVLRFVQPNIAKPALFDVVPQPSPRGYFMPLGLLFILGMTIAWGIRFLMATLPVVFKTQLPGLNTDGLMFSISIILALFALPAGKLAVKWGNQRAMFFGSLISAIFLLIIAFIHNLAILPGAIALVAGLSLVLNGAVPLALSLVKPTKGGLGVGMYFGGFTAAMSLFGAIFSQPSTSIINAILGAIAFVMAAVCVNFSTKIQSAVIVLEE